MSEHLDTLRYLSELADAAELCCPIPPYPPGVRYIEISAVDLAKLSGVLIRAQRHLNYIKGVQSPTTTRVREKNTEPPAAGC